MQSPLFFHSTIRKVQQCQGFSESSSRMHPAEKTAMSPLFFRGLVFWDAGGSPVGEAE